MNWKTLLFGVLLLQGCTLAPTPERNPLPSCVTETGDRAKNIVLFIGDGMGSTHREAAARLAYGSGGTLAMDRLSVRGLLRTSSADSEVTDSAAAASAMATGMKTRNGFIGLDAQGEPLANLTTLARKSGRSVGILTTTEVFHATPAAFASHADSRTRMESISAQMLEAGIDVLLGGGEDGLLPPGQRGCYPGEGRRIDGRNLIAEGRQRGYAYVCRASELDGLDPVQGQPLLGIFADEGMRRPFSPSLARMTEKALEILGTNPTGFLLVVEGGQIDWASHLNDTANALGDTLGLDEAVEVALEFAYRRSDTLVVVTSDHETGGLIWADLQQGAAVPREVLWTTTHHTAQEVPVTATGPGAGCFAGGHENTWVFSVLNGLLQ